MKGIDFFDVITDMESGCCGCQPHLAQHLKAAREGAGEGVGAWCVCTREVCV